MEETLHLSGGGIIRLSRQGDRVHIMAERPDDRRGLYKVWIHSGKENQLLLGTLVPEGSVLKLSRNFSVGELERRGCWPIKGGETGLAFPFEHKKWYLEQHPEQLFCDPILRRQLRGAVLCCREKEVFSVAAPFGRNCPVLLNAIFCLGEVDYLDGKPHIIWRFDNSGKPIVPGKRIS